jgi:hypothetical protein
MKTKISKMLLSLSLVFVLMGTITHSPALGSVTIQSTGDVARGETGSFVVRMWPMIYGFVAVNFSVSGTAIPGVDYVPLVSPALVQMVPCLPPAQCTTRWGVGVIKVPTLPDPRGSFFAQPYSVVVSLKAGGGYTIGEPSSAQMTIYP